MKYKIMYLANGVSLEWCRSVPWLRFEEMFFVVSRLASKVQKCANLDLLDLTEFSRMSLQLQKSASIQPRTSPTNV